MPLVSVVVPAYNVSKTIGDTINSILKQTFTDFEVIIINDGSTDNTLEVIDQIRDPRIQVFSYENGGLPEARNRGIDRATGEFITFIDADDLWTPDKLERQVDSLQQNPEAGLAYSWTCFMDSEGKSFSKDFPYNVEGNVYPRLLVGNFITSGSNVMLRASAIESVGRFDRNLKSIEDWDYWLRVAAQWPFVLVPQYQILYRQSATSMASKIDVMEKYSLIVIDRAFAKAPPELQFLKPHTLANTYQYLARICVTHHPDAEKLKAGWENLQKAIRLYPPILLDKKVQRLLGKWILLRLSSPGISEYCLNHFGKMNPKNDPRKSNKNRPKEDLNPLEIENPIQNFLNQGVL
jgi:glycosyltransferase involved in cell wall biosynthesis